MSAKSDPASIKKVIGLIKNDYRQDAKLTYLISSACMKIGNEKKTREILEEFLDKKWDDKVLSFYTDCFFESKISFKKLAEWEKSFSERYEFQLHYGNVCKKQKLWGKAQQHYEKSIEIKPSVDALVSLAEIHIVLNNEEAALKMLEKGSSSCIRKLGHPKSARW
jgi:HemY protein